MRVMINATGCPAPVSDRARMKSHFQISQLIAFRFTPPSLLSFHRS